MNPQRDRIAGALAAQQRMRDIETYNRIMATPDAPPADASNDPTLRQMQMSNEILRTSPRTFDAYLQGSSMPEDPRMRAYRGMPR